MQTMSRSTPSPQPTRASSQAGAMGPIRSTLREPLSIAMVAPCPFPTHQGTQLLIRHLANALARAGHEVHLVTYGYGEYDDSFPFHIHRAARVQTGLRSGPKLLKPAADAALLVTAKKVIKAHGCDLIHAHNVEGLGVGALLKLQTSLPMVYHSHNAMGPELPTYFRAQMAQAFASMVGDVIDRTLPRTADAVITFDPDHRSLHQVYGVDDGRLHVVPPGIDASEIGSPDPATVERLRGEIGPGPWLFYAGNPDNYQNLPLLWDAFARVRVQRPDARLLIATSHDPSAFHEVMPARTDRTGIEIYRYKDLGELRALFALADVGVSPRALWVGAPIKVLNYLAVGMPIVAVRSGSRHLLGEEVAHLVEEDPQQFADACVDFLDRGGAVRAKARRTLEKFRIENHVPLYEEVYQRVLKRSGKTAS